MSEKEVDPKALMRYIEIEKEIQQLEATNALKTYELKKQQIDDVDETCTTIAITLEQLKLQTKKEKDDVEKMKTQSIKDMFGDEKAFQTQLTKEQEEYMEALNKEECCKNKLDGLKQQLEQLKADAEKYKESAEKLKKLYEERDNLLSDIFNGEYGSNLENQLEQAFDNLMDQKQRISVANYKWTSARVLLQHAVNQLAFAVHRWKEMINIPPSNAQLRYVYATETRNNLIAAQQNINSTQKYLSNINFPYCAPPEMSTLNKATNNIYTDMQSPQRHGHALQCYDVTMRRAAALLQWFDNVIKGTIQQDLKKATQEARDVEQKLRAERIRLIRAKVEESGGDVKGLTEAGLKGLTEGFSSVDQSKITDEDIDVKGVGVIKPERVDNQIDDSLKPPDDGIPHAPTPVPLSELAPLPSEDELFGNINQLKQEYEKDTAEFIKAQQLNKARMEQGLQAKLEARRHKKHA